MRSRFKGALVAVGITFCFLLFFYSKFIFTPNQYLFSSTGDGAKAYYVYAYHIKYDTSYHQLQGMNYPFGQTYIYTDGQPAIANIVKAVCEVFPAVEYYSIGLYNALIIFSFLLTAWLVYKFCESAIYQIYIHVFLLL